ncbi:MAG: hypothetical protein VCA36_04850 [Opitutales bacterium]
MGSFPATLGDTNWFDWLWFALFLFFGSPLMVDMWKAEKKGGKQVIGLLVLVAFFFLGWAFVGYFTR